MFLVCHWYVLGMSKHTFDKPYTYQEHTHNLVWVSMTCFFLFLTHVINLLSPDSAMRHTILSFAPYLVIVQIFF